MKEDIYVQKLIWKYGVRASNIVPDKRIGDYFEFLYNILKVSDIKKIVRSTTKNLDTFAKMKGYFEEPIPLVKNRKRIETEKQIVSIKDYLDCATYDLHSWEKAFSELSVHFKFIYKKIIVDIHSILISYSNNEDSESMFFKNLKVLRATFNLNDKEVKIISFYYLLEFNAIVEDFFEHTLRMSEVIKNSKSILSLFEIDQCEFKDYFSKDSKLFRNGILAFTRAGNCINVSRFVVDFLSSSSDLKILESFVTNCDCSDAIELSEHNIKEDKIRGIVNLLQAQKGVNVLLYGLPGTGKTEFSKSLGKKLGKNVYFINQKNSEGDDDIFHRKSGIVAALNLFNPETDIIVVDECDRIINVNDAFSIFGSSGVDKKAWLNDVVENTKQKVIWISNSIYGVDDSTKRRFSFSLEFTKLTHNQKVKIWENLISKKNVDFLEKNSIDLFCKKYDLNVGSISLALKDVLSMKHLTNNEEKITTFEGLLKQHQIFLNGEKEAFKPISLYSIDVLNTDVDLSKAIEISRKFTQKIDADQDLEINNMNFLLYGAPGTGKTEFSKHFASELGRELKVKRSSDLLSKYVGETESLIAEAFKEAEATQSILFIDEADSFFGARENASASWQVSHTNELLCQMENFKGILICATNFKKILDPAAMRRFNFKIKFDYLKDDAKVKLFLEFFKDIFTDKPTSNEIEIIKTIPSLTPGDFKVVRQKNILFDKITCMELIDALYLESKHKNEKKTVKII